MIISLLAVSLLAVSGQQVGGVTDEAGNFEAESIICVGGGPKNKL